jgi:hypothetical protein
MEQGMYSELSNEQVRQAVDTEQVFAAYRDAEREFANRYSGSMNWRAINGTDYLYRIKGKVQKSLGARSPSTVSAYKAFRNGRESIAARLKQLTARLNGLAPVNQALRLGRVPQITARILRTLREKNLLGNSLCVVGTNALFAYERLCAVQIESSVLATADVDLLFDTRRQLKLASPDLRAEGLMGLLKKVDKTFSLAGRGSYRAVNADGYLVDLICSTPRDRVTSSSRRHVAGDDDNDLSAIEIEGLSWLINSPKCSQVVIDERGFPLEIVSPDPRVFALHKLWLSKREDRDPGKRQRDLSQARLIAALLRERMPMMKFDDQSELSALPLELRKGIGELAPAEPPNETSIRPDW